MRKKIGVLGGLFDPPHIAHLIIAQSVLEEFNLDAVVFVPAGKPPHKTTYTPYALRYEMTRRAIEGNRKFSISDVEHAMRGRTYTIDMIRALRTAIDGTLYLIIGADQWRDLHTWRAPHELLKECAVIIVPRPGYELHERTLKNVKLSHAPLLAVSSTDIRKKIKTQQSVQYLVPPAVLSYIRHHRLYT